MGKGVDVPPQLGILAMHAVWLVELTVALALQSRAWLKSPTPIPTKAMQGYWAISRQRLDCWHEQLRRIRQHLDRPGAIRRATLWQEAQPVIEEVLLSEVLSRVVACLSDALERRRADFDASPIANSILSSHLEARHRSLQMMVHGPGLPVELAVYLNRLRYTMERWTDGLLGLIGEDHEVESFCFSREQVRFLWISPTEWAKQPQASNMLWALLIGSLRGSLEMQLDRRPLLPRMNAKLGEHIMAFLPKERFDSFGVLKGDWREKFDAIVPETDGFINDPTMPLSSPLDILLNQPRESSQGSRPLFG